jgi:LysM repeat protein
MYYNSNKNNSAYYNAYKQEMATLEDYHDEFSFQKVLKIGIIILSLGLISILSIYLIKSFYTEKEVSTTVQNVQQTSKEKIAKVLFSEKSLPKSIQVEESIPEKKTIAKSSEVSPRDVALIVEIILAQMNHKEEISLEKQLLSAEKNEVNSKTLKESNHYNKVIVSSSEKNKSPLERSFFSSKESSSSYEEALNKELDVRSNEMRIIIVQEGDTLSKIAKKAYGDIDAYPKIFKANPELLKNPDEIFAGQRLRIPA